MLLVLVAGMLAVLLAFPQGGVFVGGASAQESAIRFLNPSVSTTVTDRELGEHGFHLNAWVANPPQNAVVQFLRNGSSIGTATRRGDTFEFFWEIPGSVPDGSHTLRARLFDGDTFVTEDEVEVNIDREAAGVRIDYPSNNSQQWGIFRPPGMTEFNGVVDVTFSSGTEQVDLFYSTSAPGTEPEWNSCDATQQVGSFGEGAETPGQTRLRCDLDQGHGPENVTAVAAVAQVCTEEPLLSTCPPMQVLGFDDHAADAHRVVTYEQIPSAVSLDVAGDRQIALPADAGRCGPAITASVTDQNNRPISRANVDVHATGPQETGGRVGLHFDTGNHTDSNKAPDEGGHQSIPARQCDEEGNDGGQAGLQGNHPRLDADTRHIESIHDANPRTDENGQFEFRLFNDEPGSTQVTAWADRDDNDLFCEGDPAGHTSLGWNEPAPPVIGHEHDAGCPEEDPTEPIGQPEREFRGRVIGLRPAPLRNRGVARGRVRNTQSGRPRCVRNRQVRVQRRPLQGGRWNNIRRPRTNRQGHYRTRNRIVRRDGRPRPGRYRAIAVRFVFTTADGTRVVCRRAVSPVRRVPRR
jgi:hypothetical protein